MKTKKQIVDHLVNEGVYYEENQDMLEKMTKKELQQELKEWNECER